MPKDLEFVFKWVKNPARYLLNIFHLSVLFVNALLFLPTQFFFFLLSLSSLSYYSSFSLFANGIVSKFSDKTNFLRNLFGQISSPQT